MGEKIRKQYTQVTHLTHDTNGKVTNSQLDTTNESQEVSRFPAGDHKYRERSGSVVECLTRDRGAAGSSLTGVTSLCP